MPLKGLHKSGPLPDECAYLKTREVDSRVGRRKREEFLPLLIKTLSMTDLWSFIKIYSTRVADCEVKIP
jgi:hypothetical protein